MLHVDVGLAGSDALDPARRAELEDGLLAIEVDWALPGERPRPDDVEVGGLDRRVEGGQDVGRHLTEVGGRRGRLMHATIAFDHGRAAAGALGAFATADRDRDEWAGRHRCKRRDRRDGLTGR